jgi:hypothetical protein
MMVVENSPSFDILEVSNKYMLSFFAHVRHSGFRNARGGFRNARGGFRNARGGFRNARGGFRNARGG